MMPAGFMTARELLRMREEHNNRKRALAEVLEWMVCISERGRMLLPACGLPIPSGVPRLGLMFQSPDTLEMRWSPAGFVPGRELELIRQWAGSFEGNGEVGARCPVRVERVRRLLWRVKRGAMGALAPLVNLLLRVWDDVRARVVWNEVVDVRVYNRQIRAMLPEFPVLAYPYGRISVEGLIWLRDHEGRVIEVLCTLERDGVMQWMDGQTVHRLTGLDMGAVYREEEGDTQNKKKRRKAVAERTLGELCVAYYDSTLGVVVAALQAVPDGLFMLRDVAGKLVEIAEDRRAISHHSGTDPKEIIAYVSFRWGFLRALHEDNLRRLGTGKGGHDVYFHHLLRMFRTLEVTLTPEGFRPAYPGYAPTPDERQRWRDRVRTYHDALGCLVELGGVRGDAAHVKKTPFNFFPGYRPPNLAHLLLMTLDPKKRRVGRPDSGSGGVVVVDRTGSLSGGAGGVVLPLVKQ